MDGVLDYLTPSETRRKLLKLLWSKEQQGTVRALAAAAGVPYAPAHKELRRMERAGLAHVESRGNLKLYRAEFGHPAAASLRALLAADETLAATGTTPADANVLRNLRALGAPLTVVGAPEQRLSVADAVVQGAKLARKDPWVTRALPVVLAAQLECRQGRDRFLQDLATAALMADARREVGLFLNLLAVVEEDPTLDSEANMLLQDRRSGGMAYFHYAAERDPVEQRFARRYTPEFAKHWGFWVDLRIDDVRAFLHKHRSGAVAAVA